MGNILIRFVTVLMITTNLFTYIVRADSENIKQCFYIVTKEQSSNSVKDDLTTLSNLQIPVVVVINPNENINENVIEILQGFQEEGSLRVILQNSDKLEKSYFVVRGYEKRINLAGLCDLKQEELIYIGEKTVIFNLINVNENPLEVMEQVNSERKSKLNQALVIVGDRVNTSTLLLAYKDLEGTTLKIENYALTFKRSPLIFNIFTHVGEITIVFFSLSIVIFLIAILIFKRWSREKFLD